MRIWNEFYSEMNKNIHDIKYGDMVVPKDEPELKHLQDEFKGIPKRVIEVNLDAPWYAGRKFIKVEGGNNYYINCLQKTN